MISWSPLWPRQRGTWRINLTADLTNPLRKSQLLMLLPAHLHDAGGATYLNMQCGSSRNGYSMFCAELMSNMKDVPSTERMVMCSQRWKLLKQNEKDGYQKRCEQVSSERVGRPTSQEKKRLFKCLKCFYLFVFRGRKSTKSRWTGFSVWVLLFLLVQPSGLVGVHRPPNRQHVFVFLSSRLCLRRSSSGCCQRRR